MIGARAVRAECNVNIVARLCLAGDVRAVICEYLKDKSRIILSDILSKPVCKPDDRTGMNTAFLAVDLGTGSAKAVTVSIRR